MISNQSLIIMEKYKYILDKNKKLSHQDIFILLCFDGKKSSAEYLLNLSKLNENWKIDINFNSDIAFRGACYNGHLNIVLWLHRLSQRDNHKIDIDGYIFRNTCYYGHKNVAEWLYDLLKIDIKIYIGCFELAFRIACEKGHKDIAKWLYDISIKNNIKIDIRERDEYAFRLACENGHYEVIVWLYNLSKTDKNTKIDIHAMKDYAFRYACENNHWKIVQWLYNLSKMDNNTRIDIHTCNEYAFRVACYKDNRDLAKWLYNLSIKDNLGTIDISNIINELDDKNCHKVKNWLNELSKDKENIKNTFESACMKNDRITAERLYNEIKYDDLEEFFRKLCKNDYKNIAEWLYNLSAKNKNNKKINIHSENNYAFRLACALGHKDTAQWLYDLSKEKGSEIDIHMNDDYVFKYASLYNHKDVIAWLCTIDNKYTYQYENDKIIVYKIKKLTN